MFNDIHEERLYPQLKSMVKTNDCVKFCQFRNAEQHGQIAVFSGFISLRENSFPMSKCLTTGNLVQGRFFRGVFWN